VQFDSCEPLLRPEGEVTAFPPKDGLPIRELAFGGLGKAAILIDLFTFRSVPVPELSAAALARFLSVGTRGVEPPSEGLPGIPELGVLGREGVGRPNLVCTVIFEGVRMPDLGFWAGVAGKVALEGDLIDCFDSSSGLVGCEGVLGNALESAGTAEGIRSA
jgi:hypothetical protein